MPTRGTVAARVAARAAGSLMAAADLEGTLTLYLASGKKKHDRTFWVSSVERGEISWDKKRCAPLPPCPPQCPRHAAGAQRSAHLCAALTRPAL